MTASDRERVRLVTPAPEPVRQTERVEPVRSHAHAVQVLDDLPLTLYAIKEGAKLSWSILVKRWPQLR